jgi:aspartyl/asparaginyl beta-hydroxylase (cupin superfamily)
MKPNKTAFVPVSELPIVKELQQHWPEVQVAAKKLLAWYGTNPKFRKIIEGGRNEENKDKHSYYGQIINIGLLLDPIVLDARERVLSFGENDENLASKMALIASRLEQALWLREWVERWKHQLVHVSLFVMYPGAEITAHYGVNNSFVRCHLGIMCPQGAKFYTEYDEPRTWSPNEVFGFLDYEVRHSVKYEPCGVDDPRVVLCFDVKREVYEQYYKGILDPLVTELSVSTTRGANDAINN